MNQWPPPKAGLQFDLEGPHASRLIDNVDIYDQETYKEVHVLPEEWDIVTQSEAEPYLPKRKTPLNVTIGVENKVTMDMPTFGQTRLDNHFKYKRGYLLNTGINIWGLDFVPKLAQNEVNRSIQYLAVSGYRGSREEHVGMNEIQPTGTYLNSIQIWKLKLSVKQKQEDAVLELCLLHDFGVVFDLQWCPYGAYEEEIPDRLPKLGILSFVAGDGTTRTVVVPHPDAVRRQMGSNSSDPNQPIYMKIKSARCTLSVPGHNPMRLAWGGHKKIAIGCTSGTIMIWDMLTLLNQNQTKSRLECLPYLLQSILILDVSISCISWNRMKDPDRIAVGGYDGRVSVVDTTDPGIHFLIARLRSIARTCICVSHCPGLFYSDNDGMTRGVLFNENGTTTAQKYGFTPGTYWDMAVSEHHGHLAFVTSLGWLRTSNIYQQRSRYTLVNVLSAYKLEYSEKTKGYRFIDGIGLQSLEDSKKLSTYQQYGETPMALQKVVWNPNRYTSGFIASGSAAGLCRIDFEGRGSKWE